MKVLSAIVVLAASLGGTPALAMGHGKHEHKDDMMHGDKMHKGKMMKGNMMELKLRYGTVKIKLRPDLAPKHVERIKKLAEEKFYDGIVFHRVIEGFMAQTGDPTGTGTGGSKYDDLPAEFAPAAKAEFKRGTIGMARSSNPNSGNSQFFICFKPAPFLNEQYTIWGEVVDGMEFVDKIKRGEPPSNPDKIVSMRVK